MSIDLKRRTFVRKLVIATRAALLQHQAEVIQAVTESLEQLDQMQKWADDGGDLPDWANRYAALREQLNDASAISEREKNRHRAELMRIEGTGGRLGDLFWVVSETALYATGHFHLEGTPFTALAAGIQAEDITSAYAGPLRAARKTLREAHQARQLDA